MKVKSVPGAWLARNGRRFDCGPYLSGALEAKIILSALPVPKEHLVDLTAGGIAGIVNAGRIKRTWAADSEHGIAFLTSSDILKADLSRLRHISKKTARNNPRLLIEQDWTLITRAGAIGRTAYSRSDMHGMACSEDVLRVIPDCNRISAGYLYAFLSSKFGIPIVTSSTYGAIIQHIEPHHLVSLPVPRLAKGIEQEAHRLVETAANYRTRSAEVVRSVAERFDSMIRPIDIRRDSPRISAVPAAEIQGRFDAQFHDPLVADIKRTLSRLPHAFIRDMCNVVFLPGIFKRVHIDDESYGAKYFTGASLFWLEPIPKGILSRKTKLFEEVLLEQNTILVQAFGQEGGLTGRSVWVGKHLDGATTTHMLVRLRTREPVETAYLYGFLQSEAAYRQIAVLTYGGSIPHLDEAGIGSVVVPLPGERDVRIIGEMVLRALTERDEALDMEKAARALVERAIEEAS